MSRAQLILALLLLPVGCTSPARQTRPIPRPATAASAEGARFVSGGVRFWLAPPEGWLIDRVRAEARGLAAVIYPKGESPEQAEAIMFVGVKPGQADLESVIRADKDHIAKGAAMIMVSEAEPQTTASGRWLHIRIFEGAAAGPQARAYVEEPGGLIVFGLRSKSPASFAWALPAFESLLASYDQR